MSRYKSIEHVVRHFAGAAVLSRPGLGRYERLLGLARVLLLENWEGGLLLFLEHFGEEVSLFGFLRRGGGGEQAGHGLRLHLGSVAVLVQQFGVHELLGLVLRLGLGFSLGRAHEGRTTEELFFLLLLLFLLSLLI